MYLFSSLLRPPPISTLFPYTTLFRSPRRRVSRAPSRRTRPTCLRTTSSRCPLRTRGCASRRGRGTSGHRSEEHTSELQSRFDLVCRLLLEKKKDRRCAYQDGLSLDMS